MLDIYSLEPGVVYKVTKQFSDYHRQRFEPGDKLIYVERHFLPYHGGHTLVFRERNIYLQEDEDRDVVERISEYLAPQDVTGG